MVGAIYAQYYTDKYGRRRTFLVAALYFILGVTITALAPYYAVLLLGRMFVGLGVGVGLAIDPLYIAEMTPAAHRGELVTWSEIALNVGIVMGFSTGLVFAKLNDDMEWRIMVAVGAILPLCMVYLVLYVMPESPRWLVAKGFEDEATLILERVFPEGYDVTCVLEDIKKALERDVNAEHALGWGVLLHPSPAIQRMLWVGLGTAVTQQAIGVDAIQYYLLDILEKSGVKSDTGKNLMLIFLGLVKLAFIVVGGKLFDRRGRRPLLFASLIGCGVALFVVSVIFFIDADGDGTVYLVTALGVYLAAFSIGMGPGAWLIPSEIFSVCIRAKAMSVATFLNRFTATLMASSFLSVKNAIGWGSLFLILCCVCWIALFFLYFMLPETKGRTLEEMLVYFAETTGDDDILETERRLQHLLVPNRRFTRNEII